MTYLHFQDEEKRKKKKVKLEMHDQQIFKDGDEYYVWIYDPVPLKTFLIGLLLGMHFFTHNV